MIQGTVLIIDDDRSSREPLQEAFISRGWEVAMAETEPQGLALLDDYDPDWVIAAWEQLRGTGAEFVRTIRTTKRNTRVTLLAEPGSGSAGFLKKVKSDLRFLKPFVAEDVFRACAALSRGRGSAEPRAV